MRLAKALKEKLHDVRLRDKLLEDGKISQKEIDTYMKSLGDESENAEYTGQGPGDINTQH
jgi:hypothetical protein